MLKFVIRESVLGYLCFKSFFLLFYDVDDSSVLGCALLNKSCISRCELLSGNYLSDVFVVEIEFETFQTELLVRGSPLSSSILFSLLISSGMRRKLGSGKELILETGGNIAYS